MSTTVATILLSDAQQMIERSIAAARSLDLACSIAVVDSSGHLLSFIRQDGAMAGSAALAIDKAFTAHIFNKRTDALNALAQPGAELYGIQHSHGGRVVVFGGGIPIQFEGRTIAAIGVSGGTVAEDIAIAEAGSVASS
ncbi:cobalamin adenosyltransferase [Rhizobium sp. L9]|uniref:GlcG/HbpS family heme-binding protein n=1 Tax=Rhizobium sp. L9 TaxID=1340738 RepID=UPI000BEABF49|nr:heme-binding protein [Rhizobium sp. L9]PDT26383.1 cobalamin adenosyltransferase [Rhizobium sp. L9]